MKHVIIGTAAHVYHGQSAPVPLFDASPATICHAARQPADTEERAGSRLDAAYTGDFRTNCFIVEASHRRSGSVRRTRRLG